MFEEPFGELAPQSTGFFEGWTPSVDVYEDKDNVIVKAELPGLNKDEIDVSLAGDTLIANLHMTLLERLGIRVDRFGNSTGRLDI